MEENGRIVSKPKSGECQGNVSDRNILKFKYIPDRFDYNLNVPLSQMMSELFLLVKPLGQE